MQAIHGAMMFAGALALTTVSCTHNDEQSARAREARANEQRRAEESRAEERRAEERRAEERRAEERRAEERRAEERRAEERRAEERKSHPSIGGGPPESTTAVAKIAAARCEREVRCNNVGTKEKFPSRAECVMRMKEDKRYDINEKDCPGGIDKKQLDACVQAIRDESCGNPLDTISRLVSCRSTAICLK